jgi:tRNA nucleotidyltransferase (CCA-adding enzyme)
MIRAVGEPEERFAEDALRILRAVRISAELGFAIEEKTRAAMAKPGPTASQRSLRSVFGMSLSASLGRLSR